MPALGNDLKTLRKQHNLSLDDVQQKTRIPIATLQAIEDSTIFEQLNGNTTYIRNYVRSYARAIGIAENDIVQALNQVQRDNYKGFLLKEDDRQPSNKKDTKKDENSIKAEKKKRKEIESPQPVEQMFSSSDWVKINQKNKGSKPTSSRKKIMWAIVILILVLVAGFFIYQFYVANSSSKKDAKEQTAARQAPPKPSDSLRRALTRGENHIANQEAITSRQGMPDTLSIAIIAANGKLEPIHVFTDITGRSNPYWVAKHDTIFFYLVNTVHIRAVHQYDRLRLLVNGHTLKNVYEKYYKTKAGSLELTRTDLRPYY